MQLKELLVNLKTLNQQVIKEKEEKKISEETISLVTFRIRNKEYAIDIDQASEIIKINKVTIVPNSPCYIKGVTNLRGEIIPIINIEEKFEILRMMRDGELQENYDIRISSEKLGSDEKKNQLLQFYEKAKSKNKTAIVVKVQNEIFALLIDEILKTISIPISRISLNPLSVKVDKDYIKGMVRRGDNQENLLLILNLERIAKN